jgi:hypothetical protein
LTVKMANAFSLKTRMGEISFLSLLIDNLDI